MELVRGLGEAPELTHEEESDKGNKIVYFDYIGLFMISYNLTAAYIINIIVTVMSIGSAAFAFYSFGLKISLRTVIVIGCIIATIFLGYILAILFILLLGLLFDFFHVSMSWYGNNYLVVGLFCIPTLLFQSLTFSVLKTFKKVFSSLSLGAFSQVEIHVTRVMWSLVMFVMTLFEIRSAYLLLIPIIFNTAAFLMVQAFKWQHSGKLFVK